MDPDALLDGLDPDQRAVVTSPAAPLVVLAPAGSGKTRVLTRRIAHLVATDAHDPRHVLALTFTRRAAAELGQRLRRLGLRDHVTAGTFHAVAWGQLRTWWRDRDRTPPVLLDRKGRLLHDLVPSGAGRDRRTTAAALATEIEWAKARGITPDEYEVEATRARRKLPMPAAKVADRYATYEERKRAGGLLDFDDILAVCTRAMHEDRRFAAAQRWRHRHLFVDELQDINPLQFALLEAWRGDRYDVCAVGDPQQAIYGWNGADPSFLRDIRHHWPGAEVIELRRSYRSTPEILSSAAQVLRAAGQPVADVSAARPTGARPVLTGHDTDRTEAIGVARAVRLAHAPGRPWAEQAVLVRTHAQVPLITEALREAGIPHRVRGAGGADDPTVHQALQVLRASGPELATALVDLETALAADDAPDDLAPGLVALLVAGRDHLRLDPLATVESFSAWLRAVPRRDGLEHRGDAVDVATFHAAKGLEWAVVHLAGIEDGFVPIAHARTRAARAEEARLLYVAMTRAQRELRISWARRRVFAGAAVERRCSPLLGPLSASSADAPATSGSGVDPGEPTDWRARLAEQRALLARPRGDRQAPARQALLAWRATTARAARAEPGAVLSDAVLDRIVAAEPSTVDELMAVPGVGPLLARRLGADLLAALDRTSHA